MTTQDITRHLLQPGKHYAGVRMQQGRTVLDSDWNEDAMLEAEDLRATLADLTGAHGTTNDGFAISDVNGIYHPSLDGLTYDGYITYDFTIAPGSMFVGGLRVELEQPEHFLAQADWLRQDASIDNLPRRPWMDELPQFPNQVRYDLVYLHVWEQVVSMVEDSELRERALGGPDSTTRVRRMRRVEVATDVGSEKVDEAFDALIARLEQGATFEREQAELVSNGRLWVTPILDGEPSPCGPLVTGGYLGNEHQAIRVEQRGPKSFTWGFGNAAPLHRAWVVGPATSSGGGTVIELRTSPRDSVARPCAKQIVELLPRGARLPNGEYVAELQGPLFRVIGSYDPGTRQLIIAGPLPIDWANEREVYLRIWDRGPDDESEVEIPFLEGVPVPLGYTGLQVAFRPSGRIADFWVIAARKGANTRVLPWELLDGAAPHGTRHFYAPLAIIRWQEPTGVLGDIPPAAPSIRDVRRRLQPLCQRGCCTITVGDGVVSHGQVDSLSEAIALLPLAGGRICLLPGNHDGGATLSDRANVEIVGCGPRSVLANASPVVPQPEIDTAGPPLLTLDNCTNVVVANLAIAGFASVGLDIRDSQSVEVARVEFAPTGFALVGTSYASPQAALRALGCDDLSILDCRVDVEDVLNYTPALVVGGTRLRLHRNWVQVGEAELGSRAAMGGIHVLSQSRDVELVRNVIRNGWGNGVTLGHLLAMEPPPAQVTLDLDTIWTAAERGLGEALTNTLAWVPVSGAPTGVLVGDEVWTTLGAVTDLRVRDNDIRGMMLSGIATVFVPPGRSGVPITTVVIAGDIHSNHVRDNASITGLALGNFTTQVFALGGVALAGCISTTIRENVICDNGSGYEIPICGVAVIGAQDLSVEDNRIVDNGTQSPAETVVSAKGCRGGICVNEAIGVRGHTFVDAIPNVHVPRADVEFGSSTTALRVHHNEVSQRTGKALWVRRGFGPIVVTENSLRSLGDPVEGNEIANSTLRFEAAAIALNLPAQGACVEILDFATSTEVDYGVGTVPTPVIVDSTSEAVPDGRVLLSGNHIHLSWSWPGGYASSVLVSSLDSVVVNHNTMVAEMFNTISGTPSYVTAMIATPIGFSFLFTNCWLGAASTVQATGNRFQEGLEDSGLSLLETDVITANGLEIQNALLATMNVGTHCISGKTAVTPPPQKVFTNNVVIQTATFGEFCDTNIDYVAGPPQIITVTVP